MAVLAVLRPAALQPGPIDDELLATVLGMPVGSVGAALRQAREAGVLTVADGVHAFRHAMQAEVLVDQLGSGERRALHAAFADALAGTRGSGARDGCGMASRRRRRPRRRVPPTWPRSTRR